MPNCKVRHMTNMKFRYLYRDASSYKKWNAVVFSNSEALSATAVTRSLMSHFWPEGLFIASQISVPEVFLFDDYPLNVDDHCFHEYGSVEVTEEAVNDRLGRSITEFVRDVENAGREGWDVFDPLEPFAQEFRIAYKRMFPG
jgi:hypothetical protein